MILEKESVENKKTVLYAIIGVCFGILLTIFMFCF